ncbi:MAG: putative polymerase subfamily sigma factor [Ilumatobacteraceae bacterium]|nr:putative polymerase subfamily sigma factor [Ilumatobacteraceae bacterium]
MEPVLVRVDSFESFYRARYRSALRLAIVLTGSTAAAEDLVQDAMADAHRLWSRLAGYDDANAWLRRAIVNRAISRRRRLGVAARGALRLDARTSTQLDLPARDWELWAHVRALPTRQAQLIALVYVDGLTIVAAASTLGIATATANTHLARAKERLERDLADWRTS